MRVMNDEHPTLDNQKPAAARNYIASKLELIQGTWIVQAL